MILTTRTFCWLKIVRETKRQNIMVSWMFWHRTPALHLITAVKQLCPYCDRRSDIFIIFFFFSPRSNSTEDWHYYKTAVFFRDEEQRAWDWCDKPGIWMKLEKYIFFSIVLSMSLVWKHFCKVWGRAFLIIATFPVFCSGSMKRGGWWTSWEHV